MAQQGKRGVSLVPTVNPSVVAGVKTPPPENRSGGGRRRRAVVAAAEREQAIQLADAQAAAAAAPQQSGAGEGSQGLGPARFGAADRQDQRRPQRHRPRPHHENPHGGGGGFGNGAPLVPDPPAAPPLPQGPTAEEVVAGLREMVGRTLLWLPRTPENHVYIVRVARNYLNRRDPDAALGVHAQAREELEALWQDIRREEEIPLERRTNWPARAGRHSDLCAQEPVGLWDIRRWSANGRELLDAFGSLFPNVARRHLGFTMTLSLVGLLLWAPTRGKLCGLYVRALRYGAKALRGLALYQIRTLSAQVRR